MQLISNRGNCIKYNITDASSVLEVFTRHKLSRQSLFLVVFPVCSPCPATFLKYLPSSRTAGLIGWVGFPPISGKPLEFGLDSFSKALSSPRLKDAPENAHSTSVAACRGLIPHFWGSLLWVSLAIKQTNLSDVQSTFSWGGDNTQC